MLCRDLVLYILLHSELLFGVRLCQLPTIQIAAEIEELTGGAWVLNHARSISNLVELYSAHTVAVFLVVLIFYIESSHWNMLLNSWPASRECDYPCGS
jgi:hypothetical protein